MAGEWKASTVGEFCPFTYGKALPERSRMPGVFPVISSAGISGSHNEPLVTTGGIVIGRKGTVGSVTLSKSPFWPIDTTFYIADEPQRDLRFTYYLLKTLGLDRMNSDSAVPGLNRDDAHARKIFLPGLEEQRAIAHILGTLDDKIELLRRQNETLEAMARALFKDWFVDFGPVRAKIEGREPYLPREVWDLFPDRLVESEIGEIPEGWDVGVLGDVAEHLRRSAQPDRIEPDTPYIALEHMPRRCISLADWGTAEGLESNKFAFRQGEILFGKLRPYFHKVGVAPVDGVCSTDIVVVAPKNSHWFGFVLGHVSSSEFVEYTNAGSTGTKMPRTSWADMARYEVVLPPEPVAEALTQLVQPLVERIIAAIRESRTLSALRDTLLPKLISGELRVPSAARQLKEMA